VAGTTQLTGGGALKTGDALLLATTNPGKIREIRDVLAGLPVRVLTLDAVPQMPPPDETGRTFAENAALKARAYAAFSGLATVAEDSGLAIDALGGRPGVESARYPGDTYAEKFENLYRELAQFPHPWTARFVCSLAFVPAHAARTDEPIGFATEAMVEGEISPAPRGSNGFGYDPVFYYPSYACTLAEADTPQKLAVAHRGKAFRIFRRWIETQLELDQVRS
jgi:XTP/dITP diphosphohydrolase